MRKPTQSRLAIRAVMAGALITASFAAQAQNPAEPPSSAPGASEPPQSTIIVEGGKSRRKAILRYIRTNLGEEPSGQYAKFEDPICPSAFGLAENVASFIETRMRDVAKAADVKIAPADCDPNVHLIIVEDGPAAVNDLRAKGKGAFGQMPAYARRELAERSGPVFEWRVVSPIGTDGNTDRSTLNAGLANDLSNSSGGVYAMLSDERFNTARTNSKSRILQPVRQRVGHAIVMIEKDAILGLSPVQIADFGILTALARPDGGSDAAPSPGSIRSLFDVPQDEAPELLSDLDLALLKSLYAARGDLRASAQRAAMVKVFERTLEE